MIDFLSLSSQWGTGMGNISRDAHIPLANVVHAGDGLAGCCFVVSVFQMQTALGRTLDSLLGRDGKDHDLRSFYK